MKILRNLEQTNYNSLNFKSWKTELLSVKILKFKHQERKKKDSSSLRLKIRNINLNEKNCFPLVQLQPLKHQILLTATYGKHIPTIKLAVQLVKPATAMAEGLGPCENNSATMNQGMGPGPISKNATKAKMATMLTYDIHLSWFCGNRRGE